MAQIDYSKPLVLGFSFSHAADKVDELIAAYKEVGIPDEDIRIPEKWLVEEWKANGWKLCVYAKGSEVQQAAISKRGYEFETGHVLGPWK